MSEQAAWPSIKSSTNSKTILKLKHGSVWLADLNPKRGTEPGKIRPVYIIQHQALLDALHPSTLVIPLTTKLMENAEPLRIRLHAQNLLKKDSDLLIEQIRALDNKRFITGPLVECSEDFRIKVNNAMKKILAIN